MNYEKEYEEAVKRAKAMIKVAEKEDEVYKITITIFPELKEESEDEKIRKQIKAFIKSRGSQITQSKTDAWIAWLEKQGEKPQGKTALEAIKEEKVDNQNCIKPIDNIEPKFHEGDWVVYNNEICQIVKREEGCNKLVTVFGIEKELVNERNLSTARLWTIQDAKEGDVLITNKKQPFIFNGHYDKDTDYIYAYCGISDIVKDDSFYTEEECVDEEFKLWCTNENVCPATKEQRDTLFKAMADAGWEFDFEKKELKKIEQKPAWSEEDKNFMYDILSNLTELKDRYGEGYGNVGRCIDWLKSLKDCVQTLAKIEKGIK